MKTKGRTRASSELSNKEYFRRFLRAAALYRSHLVLSLPKNRGDSYYSAEDPAARRAAVAIDRRAEQVTDRLMALLKDLLHCRPETHSFVKEHFRHVWRPALKDDRAKFKAALSRLWKQDLLWDDARGGEHLTLPPSTLKALKRALRKGATKKATAPTRALDVEDVVALADVVFKKQVASGGHIDVKAAAKKIGVPRQWFYEKDELIKLASQCRRGQVGKTAK